MSKIPIILIKTASISAFYPKVIIYQHNYIALLRDWNYSNIL